MREESNMIQICTIVYKNYDILDMFLNHHLNYLEGDYEILVCDNTPKAFRQVHRHKPTDKVKFYELDLPEGLDDGESQVSAINHLFHNVSTAEIIGFQDSDLFLLNKKILSNIEDFIHNKGVCFGCALHYRDAQKVYDTRYTERAGHMAPSSQMIYMPREFALKQNMMVTRQEGRVEQKEVMWRLRENLIQNNLKRHTIQGFYKEGVGDAYDGMVFFGTEDNIEALHVLKGSFGRQIDYNYIQQVIDKYKR